MSREEMLRIFPERGGDPDRPGKKDPLDCVVWRGERPGEPAWDSPFGPGRPGWHIECSAIALDELGETIDVQAGGSDLIFPHHEMCANGVQVATGKPFAQVYAHAGMVAYDGAKMSKSLGNLVFVSQLRNSEVDPMGIRLTLLRHHYRSDWEWVDDELWTSVDRLAEWRQAFAMEAGAPSAPVVEEVLAALAADLDAPRACAAVDAWVDATLAGDGPEDGSPPPYAMSSTRRWASSDLYAVGRGAPSPVTRPGASRSTSTGLGGASAPPRPTGGGQARLAAALQVPLELAGDGLAGGLGELGGVAGLLERPHVLGDVLVLLGELVDAALPGAGVLGQVAERDADLEQVLDAAEQGQRRLRARAAARRSAGRPPSTTRPGCRDARRRPGRRRRCRSVLRTSTARA